MAVLVGIAILAVVIFFMNRRGGAGMASGGVGGGVLARRRKAAPCAFERVNPEETRMLKEYRCARCGDVAYGRGDAPPAERGCKAG
ncbi:MAG: hypothetical protein AAFM92_06655 [Pseudomonadota bacterium]